MSVKVINRENVTLALTRHVGKDKAITASALVREIVGETLHCDAAAERLLRSVVSELRGDGIAICANPAHGYFIAQTAEELEECCGFLRQRALHSLRLESRLRNISMADLMGQIHVPT
jgi:hypothetical protein